MFKSRLGTAFVAALAASVISNAVAASDDSKKAANMLFDTPHIATVSPGTKFVYKFERLPSDEKVLGKGFTDDISVDVEAEGAPGKKNVVVRMFSGERGREPNRIISLALVP